MTSKAELHSPRRVDFAMGYKDVDIFKQCFNPDLFYLDSRNMKSWWMKIGEPAE